MTRTWFPPENRTLGDLRACLRWFRSRHGPLHAEFETGNLSTEPDGVLSFRGLLKRLDGSQRDVDGIDIFTGAREVNALFSMYRRMRRAEQRAAHALREAANA